MQIEIVLAIICVVFGGSIFIGHAFGYNAGKKYGFRQGVRYGRKLQINSQYGKTRKVV